MTIAEANITALKSSKETRGKRLKIARARVGLTRAEIERRYGINRLTQANWENGKAGGLTEKGAKRMVYAFKEEGLHCTVDWLMDGLGSEPFAQERLYIGSEIVNAVNTEITIENSISEEIATFKRFNPGAIDFKIMDDGMLPFYQIGDYVAGIQWFGTAINNLVGRDCIIVLKNGDILLRHLRKGENDTYTLVCINPDTSVKDYILQNRELLSAASIIWHRRQNER